MSTQMYYLIAILGMAVVTYLPRVIPLIWLKNLEVKGFWREFFILVPYAILGVLTFPKIFTSTASPISALVGGIAAIILAFFRVKLVWIIIGAIAAVWLTETLVLGLF